MDCERLYTKIDLQDMRVKVLEMVRRIFDLPEHVRLGHVAVKVTKDKHPEWLPANKVPAAYHDRTVKDDDGDRFVIFDLNMVDMWVTFLLDDLFVTFGPLFLRQAIGAPMGANCSGGLVNLYLSSFELAFVEQLSTTYAAPDSPPPLRLLALLLQRAFLLTSRFLDDISSINNPYFQELLYNNQTFADTPIRGIYPPQLNIKTTGSGLSVDYLNVTVKPVPHRLHWLTTVHFDTRFVPPMSDHSIVRFPHMSSHIGEDVKYNILVGFFHSFRRAILDRTSFVCSLADVVVALVAKGYDRHRMLQDIRLKCTHHPGLFGATPDALYQQICQEVATGGVQL